MITLTTETSALDVEHYKSMGFQQVCRVNRLNDNTWYYTSIDHEIMYSDHRSWIYFITVDGRIQKIGETGNPLGIKSSIGVGGARDTQPKTGSESRLGRYRKGDQTDSRCREELKAAIDQGCLVEFWAYKCPIKQETITLNEQALLVSVTHHKDLEMVLMDYYKQMTGSLPPLNLSRK